MLLLSQGMNYMPVELYHRVSPALWMPSATPAGPTSHTSYNNVMLLGG